MENYQNTTRDRDGQNVENESWTTNNQNPPVQKNPYDDSQEIDNDRSNLYPEDESSLDTSPTYNQYEDDEDEITDEDEDEDEDDELDNDNDLDNDPFEEDGDFEEKDNDYRENKEKDIF